MTGLRAPAIAAVVFISDALYCRIVCTADKADLSFICPHCTALSFIIKLMRDSRQNPQKKSCSGAAIPQLWVFNSVLPVWQCDSNWSSAVCEHV